MDLRIVKTRKGIKEAYLNLRKSSILENIKVKDICNIALINKTTFYKHYKDVYDLNNQLEDEAINNFINDVTEKDCLFDNPEKFIKSVAWAAEKNQEALKPIFDGSNERMYRKLEKRFSDYYKELLGDDADEVMIMFAIGGISYTLKELYFKKATMKEKLCASIGRLVDTVQDKYKKKASQNV